MVPIRFGELILLYRFGECVLDTQRRELRRGDAACPIEPQVFDLLRFLIENRERALSRDEIFAAVWDGRIVSESTLATRISQARAAIGDDGEQQRLIKTLHGKGFRFLGDIRQDDGSTESAREPVGQSANGGAATPAIDRPDKGARPRRATRLTFVAASLVAIVALMSAAYVLSTGRLETKAALASDSTVSGRWTGSWSNELGDKGVDAIELAEDQAGNISGLWSGTISVSGKRVNQDTIELSGQTPMRSYQATATVLGGQMTLTYIVTRLDEGGSYQGTSTLSRK